MIYITIILVASGLFLIIYSFFVSSPQKTYDINADSSLKKGKEKKPVLKEPGKGNKAKRKNVQPNLQDIETSEEDETELNIENTNIKDDEEEIISQTNEKEEEKREGEVKEDKVRIILDDTEEKKKKEVSESGFFEEANEIKEEKSVEQLGEKKADFNTATKIEEKEAEINKTIISKTNETEKPQKEINTAVLYDDSSNILNYNEKTSTIDISLNEYKKIKRRGRGRIEVLDNGVSFKSGDKEFRYDFQRLEKIISGNNFLSLFLKKSRVVRLFIFDQETSLGKECEEIYNEFKIRK